MFVAVFLSGLDGWVFNRRHEKWQSRWLVMQQQRLQHQQHRLQQQQQALQFQQTPAVPGLRPHCAGRQLAPEDSYVLKGESFQQHVCFYYQ